MRQPKTIESTKLNVRLWTTQYQDVITYSEVSGMTATAVINLALSQFLEKFPEPEQISKIHRQWLKILKQNNPEEYLKHITAITKDMPGEI